MTDVERVAETVAKAMKLCPTAIRAEVMGEEMDTVALELDGLGLFFLKVEEA